MEAISENTNTIIKIQLVNVGIDIDDVWAYASTICDNVDYTNELDGSFDLWGWSDDTQDGKTDWRINITIKHRGNKL